MSVRLTPILPVSNVADELDFYLKLGFDQHVDPTETYPVEQFAALTRGAGVLFGLALHDDPTAVPPAGLAWQFETTDLEGVRRAAESAGLEIVRPVAVRPWGRRTMELRTPNGYSVSFEEVG